ncbi:hypothetical protein MAM1_0010d01097 [Mucor ambiguus]|uniref:Protein kinase domain-containing protein n=1 Tax=Mucor ambiguus TaxID=91626 RepID=A0A0C9MI93_9FUNG|nr:hypothetical protein MAM1_0010d01097 [Mucor ambiguus]
MPITHYNNSNNNKHNSKAVRSNSLAQKKWWQKLAVVKKFKSTSTSQRSGNTEAQDWRTLSPNEPPLPFLLSVTSPSPCNNIAVSALTNPCSVVPSSIKFSEADRFASELAPIFKECQSDTLCSFPSSTSFSTAAAAAAVVGSRGLYTIQETSETSTLSNSNHVSTNSSIKGDSTSRDIASSSLMSLNRTHCNNIFSHNNSNDHMSLDGYETAPSSWSISPPTSPVKFKPIPNIRIIDVKYEDSVTTNDDDDDANSLSISNATDQLLPSSSSEPKMILVEEDDENDSIAFTPIFEWPSRFIKSPEPHFNPSLVGNEDECRLQFCKLVAQAYQQYRQGQHDFPKDVQVLFDEKDNIRGITIISQKGGRDDYLEFGGSPQYIAPELSVCPVFHYEQSSIWALGISLYRMLMGKYPFYSVSGRNLTHREVFRKMLTSDFVLSKALSSDVRDLIQRMLSPENARASFDLVMFHPWIQPYVYWSDSVVRDHQEQAEAARAAAALLTTASAAPSQSTSKSKHKKHRKRIKKAALIIRKVIRIIFKGPYPPPASYHDLVDPNYKKKNQ